MTTPTEPARGPSLDVTPTNDALPPFEKSAAIAFACAIFPYLVYIGAFGAFVVQDPDRPPTFGVGYMLWSAVTSLGGFVGPIVGFALGGATARRLKAIPVDDRPRGLAMANAARWIGLVTISLWLMAVVVVCGALMMSGAGGD